VKILEMTTKYQISEPSGQAIYSIKNVKQLPKIHGTVATLRQRVNGEWDTAQRKTILLGASVSLPQKAPPPLKGRSHLQMSVAANLFMVPRHKIPCQWEFL
jgi:hypothetical protein